MIEEETRLLKKIYRLFTKTHFFVFVRMPVKCHHWSNHFDCT